VVRAGAVLVAAGGGGMMPEELALARVLAHPLEAVSGATIHRARHDAPLVHAGTTEHFVVEYQRHLGAEAEMLAHGVLGMCETDFRKVQGWFSGATPDDLPFRCVIVRGNFGAFHGTCADTELHVAAFDEHNSELVEMVHMAEVVEVFSAHQRRGWNCGASNGEGLSRVLATELHPSQLDGFATAAAWLNSRRPNFVDLNDPTDQHAVSTGCAVLVLNYLRYQLGYSWQDIVAHDRPTLAETAYSLTKKASNVWATFSTLMDTHFPPGERVQLVGDNVFPLKP
jgi:hypothetical protein